jgi:transposase
MRKIEEVLRLSAQGKSVREISRATGVSRPSVATYLGKATEHEIGWPLPAGMDAQAVEQLLFGVGCDTKESTWATGLGEPSWRPSAQTS